MSYSSRKPLKREKERDRYGLTERSMDQRIEDADPSKTQHTTKDGVTFLMSPMVTGGGYAKIALNKRLLRARGKSIREYRKREGARLSSTSPAQNKKSLIGRGGRMGGENISSRASQSLYVR